MMRRVPTGKIVDVPRLLLLVLVGQFIVGCSKGPTVHPVRGRVVLEDGQPLTTGGSVFFDPVDGGEGGEKGTARGAIMDDGTFVMGTYTADDGAYPGKHRVMVKAMRDPKNTFPDSIVPRPVLDDRFEDYNKSGIEVEIVAGENEIEIKVERAAQ